MKGTNLGNKASATAVPTDYCGNMIYENGVLKKVLFLFISMLVCTTICGQQITLRLNNYRSHDPLTKQRVTADIEALLSSRKAVWSLEEAELSEESYNTEYTTETDTLMAVERGNRTYYSQDRGAISVIGSENFMELMSYDMPETWLQFPMQVGDSVAGYFNASGSYCERFFMRRYGTYKTKADALGMLVLPQGDTLHNVIRLHTERYVGTIAIPIDTMKYRIPAFTVDSIVIHLAPDTAKVREDEYRWYAEGYRYPILEAKILSYCDSMLTEEMYFCGPEVQRALAYDEENEAIRVRLAEEEQARLWGSVSEETANSRGSDSGFRYDISQDDGNGQVAINYTADHDVRMTALVANTLGYVYKRAEQDCPAGSGHIPFDCNGLPRGQYIIYINVDGDKYAEKINLK